MRKIEIRGRFTKGVLSLNSQEFTRLCKLMEDGEAVITVELLPNPKTIEEYREWYFAMRDIVAEETGNTKKAIHLSAKNRLLDGESTKTLDVEGWQHFIKEFKSWVFEHFNVYL